MKVVIVTGNRPHCVYLCKELSKKYDVSAIFHFKGDHEEILTSAQREERYRILCDRHGAEYVESHYKAFYPKEERNVKFQHGYEEADIEYADSMDYGDFDQNNIISCEDINSEESIAKIKSYSPDVIVCHGGPIYSKQFIESFNLVLNYHSGISPIYNGADSHMFAFANGHPHLSGGTLMVMNAKIDGGDILAHYFPKIESGDWPGRLFTRGILGTVKLYDSFLNHISKNDNYCKVAQCKTPLFYYRRINWGGSQYHQMAHNVKSDISKKYVREEKIVEYWACENNMEASHKLKSELMGLLINSQ